MNPRRTVLARSWDSKAYVVHRGNHSTVANAEITSSWNWKKRVAIPSCFVQSFIWTTSTRHGGLSSLEGTRCQRLAISHVAFLSASRWRRTNFFRYNHIPYLKIAKPWVTKWHGCWVCWKTPHEPNKSRITFQEIWSRRQIANWLVRTHTITFVAITFRDLSGPFVHAISTDRPSNTRRVEYYCVTEPKAAKSIQNSIIAVSSTTASRCKGFRTNKPKNQINIF